MTWDWEASAWLGLPLGAKLNKLVHVGGHPVQFSVSSEHNFADDFPVPRDLYGVGLKLLMPAG